LQSRQARARQAEQQFLASAAQVVDAPCEPAGRAVARDLKRQDQTQAFAAHT
jgi:hypothetical protein